MLGSNAVPRTSRLRLALCALLLLGSGGCVERLVEFRVHRLLGAQVRGIDGEGFSMVVRVEVENPNPVGARISDIHFRSFTGSHLLGRGALAGPVQAPARARFALAVPLRVAYADLPADLPQRAADGTLPLRTEARFRASSRLGSMQLTLVSRGQVKVADTLAVAIRGPFSGDAVRVRRIELAELDLRTARLRLHLLVRNRFAFPIGVRRARCELEVSGAPFGRGELKRPLRLPPRGEARIAVEVLATHGAVGRGVLALLGGDPRFVVRGTLWIDPIGGVSQLPLQIETDASIFERSP